MKISLAQLISVLGLNSILNEQKMSLQAAYNISKIFDCAQENYYFYRKEFDKIVDEYGQKDDEGNLVLREDGNLAIDPDKVNECAADMRELENLQVEIPDYSISINHLEDLKLTLEQFNLLKPFVKDI